MDFDNDKNGAGGGELAAIMSAMLMKDNDKSSNAMMMLLVALLAGGAFGKGNKQNELDRIEIMQKLEHNEDRRVAADTQKEIAQQAQSFMQMGFGLSGQVKDSEVKGMENFAKLEYQMGELNQGMKALLTEKNNDQIINGVLNRLWGAPCGRAC